MKTPIQRVSLKFAQGSDAVVEETAEGVIANLYGNAAFATPPVDQADLQTALDAFRAAKAAMVQSGTAATAAKNDRKRELCDLLRTLAYYVQVESQNVLATLLSSGFQAVSTNRALIPLVTPQIRGIQNDGSGRLLVDVEVVDGARCYEIDLAELDAQGTPGPFTTAGLYSRSRRMPLTGLTPGTRYAARARAIGGSNGSSGWSDEVVHMSL